MVVTPWWNVHGKRCTKMLCNTFFNYRYYFVAYSVCLFFVYLFVEIENEKKSFILIRYVIMPIFFKQIQLKWKHFKGMVTKHLLFYKCLRLYFYLIFVPNSHQRVKWAIVMTSHHIISITEMLVYLQYESHIICVNEYLFTKYFRPSFIILFIMMTYISAFNVFVVFTVLNKKFTKEILLITLKSLEEID